MEKNVIIIGAGVAGLCAADQLLESGFSPLIVEASDRIGGRVRALEGFADVPIELGAEEIHGPDNAVAELAMEQGADPVHHLTTDDIMRLDGELISLDQAERDPDVQRAFKIIDELGDYRGENWTVEEFMRRAHFPRRAWHYLDSRLGVEHGTTLDRLAMRGFATYKKGWEARETNYTLRGRYLSLFDPMIARLQGRVRLNSPVAAIEWSGTPKIRLQNAEELSAAAVVVTVPLPILRDDSSIFHPNCPPKKWPVPTASAWTRA